MMAVAYLDPAVYAVLTGAGFIIAVVALILGRFRSLLAWACVLVFLAVAWNGLASA